MPRATRSQFCQDVRAKAAALQIKDAEHADVWAMVQSLSLAYPEDPAIIAPLYLNVLNLLAGQAIYLPAGILHAYVEGFGVELMAASDNVLRGGLTTKHIDLAELQKVLSFEPYYPKILGPAPLDLDRYTYQSPSKEFSLTVLRSTKKNVEINEGEPHIIVVTEGTASLKDDSGIEIELAQGESALILASSKKPRLSGTFQAYDASLGSSR
jgi:mannose-6-phosphate isomerase